MSVWHRPPCSMCPHLMYVYVGVRERDIKRTITIGKTVLVDLDENDEPVGVEILAEAEVNKVRRPGPSAVQDDDYREVVGA